MGDFKAMRSGPAKSAIPATRTNNFINCFDRCCGRLLQTDRRASSARTLLLGPFGVDAQWFCAALDDLRSDHDLLDAFEPWQLEAASQAIDLPSLSKIFSQVLNGSQIHVPLPFSPGRSNAILFTSGFSCEYSTTIISC